MGKHDQGSSKGQLSFEDIINGQLDYLADPSRVRLATEYVHINPDTELGRLGCDILRDESTADERLLNARGIAANTNAAIKLSAAKNAATLFSQMYLGIALSHRLNPYVETFGEIVDVVKNEALERLGDEEFEGATEVLSLEHLIYRISDLYLSDESHFSEIPRELDVH